ncbi:MAG: hypothetical protein H0Z34_17090, partial [Brevibacillus sp.]|nr:hypothetical protein [Brevibacillus sp.]
MENFKRLILSVLCFIIFCSPFTALPKKAHAATPSYGTFSYGEKPVQVYGDLSKAGVGITERPSTVLWHQNKFKNIVTGQITPSDWRNDVQFDIQETEPTDNFSGRRGFHLVELKQPVVKEIAQQANGNPDFVWLQVNDETKAKHYLVDNDYHYVDYGSIIKWSGGGAPNQQSGGGNGVSGPLFKTTWTTTPWPVINQITFNGDVVATNITRDNSTPTIGNYILKGGSFLTVQLKQTVYGVNKTRNISKISVDGVADSNIGKVGGEAGGTYPMDHTFTISNPDKLVPGSTHTITFEVKDDFGRWAKVDIRYTVEGEAAPCDPATSGTLATLKPSGGSSQTIPSMGTYELPEGSDKVTLTFPQEGTLKVNGADFGGVSKTFTVPISGQTEIYFESTDGTDCWLKTIVPTVPDDECDPATSAMQMTLDIWGSDTDKRVTLDSSGTYGLERDVDTLQFWPGVKGTYYKNGSEVASGVSTYSFDVGASGGSFTIKFVSEDGDCWEKRFGFEKEDGQVGCPEVRWIDDDKDTIMHIDDGETIYLRTNDELNLAASYKGESGKTLSASVFWKFTRPDGRVIELDDDPEIYFDVPRGGSKYIRFDVPGTYEISIFFDDRQNYEKDWIEQGCSWKMFVVVEDSY